MDTSLVPPDFKEFLRSLNSNGVEYLLIGDYAVGYHGYPRPTGDLDIWINSTPENAGRTVNALSEFGFDCSASLLLNNDQLVRMGVAPFRIELLTTIDGVSFSDCYPERVLGVIDGVEVTLISLARLKENKRASGRSKDLADLENLP